MPAAAEEANAVHHPMAGEIVAGGLMQRPPDRAGAARLANGARNGAIRGHPSMRNRGDDGEDTIELARANRYGNWFVGPNSAIRSHFGHGAMVASDPTCWRR